MFREKIQQNYDDLTPSFRKLADFMLQNQLDAAFMTATELANRLGVDAATVVRFAQELGYTGFRELSKEIQEVVRSELKASYTADLDAAGERGGDLVGRRFRALAHPDHRTARDEHDDRDRRGELEDARRRHPQMAAPAAGAETGRAHSRLIMTRNGSVAPFSNSSVPIPVTTPCSRFLKAPLSS